MTSTNAIASIGHNNPPSDHEIISEQMTEKYAQILSRAKELMDAETRVPTEIKDDDESGKVGDYIKQVTACHKELVAIRIAEKEPWLSKERAVDGFFNKFTESLKNLKDRVSVPHAAYMQKKKDELKRKKEQEAERLRKEAEEKLREAQRRQKEAEEALAAKQREAERVAKEAAEAQRKREEAHAAELKAKQAEIDRLNKEKADQEAIAAANAEKERLEREQRDANRAARKVEKIANEGLELLQEEADTHKRESDEALDAAANLDKQSQRMKLAAKDPNAINARIRGAEGSLSTIRHEWVGQVSERDALDLEALRPHFRDQDLQFALNSWVKANPGKQLKGALVFQDTKAQVR